MNLSISNIAWTSDYDVQMYAFLKEIGYNGLEIAPTRLFIDHPYTHIEEAKEYLVENGELWIVIQKKQGAPSAKAKMEEVYGNCEVVDKDKGYFILKSIRR